MPPRAPLPSLEHLRAACRDIPFQPHRITHLLDAEGRHDLELPGGFPFAVSLFRFRSGEVTRRLTWHRRLELLVPLDGPMQERMGDLIVPLHPGDLLVVDHLKPHQVVDAPGLDTRVIVLSFLPECVFTPGSPPTDYAFLIPFHRRREAAPNLLPSGAASTLGVHEALARLLGCYFAARDPHREAGCKAWLLVVLHALVHAFRHSDLERAEVLQRQEQATRLQPLLDHVRDHYADRITLAAAAAMCGMSPARFGRVFKQVAGMSLGGYLNQVRMARAVECLEQSTDSIAAIALALGFSDQSHFDRRFRQTFGRSPSQHRAGVRPGRTPHR